jgi:hypothetical protein
VGTFKCKLTASTPQHGRHLHTERLSNTLSRAIEAKARSRWPAVVLHSGCHCNTAWAVRVWCPINNSTADSINTQGPLHTTCTRQHHARLLLEHLYSCLRNHQAMIVSQINAGFEQCTSVLCRYNPAVAGLAFLLIFIISHKCTSALQHISDWPGKRSVCAQPARQYIY